MASSPNFPRFDGLMDLAKREGVDIRPTLLRVLTDLYVQSPLHTDGEEAQFVELAGRLIDEVDDATRAAVRSRLAIYPRTPATLLHQLELFREPDPPAAPAAPPAPVAPPQPRRETPVAPPSQIAVEAAQAENIQALGQIENIQILSEAFFAAGSAQRTEIMRRFDTVRLATIPRISTIRAGAVVDSLEQAAMRGDRAKFCYELAEVLILPRVHVNRIVDDPGGEPLVLALKLLAMPPAVFQRVAMFVMDNGETSVECVFRMSRLYDAITFHDANVMLAGWRAASVAQVRAPHRSYHYDDETSRARSAPAATRTERPAMAPMRPSRNAG